MAAPSSKQNGPRMGKTLELSTARNMTLEGASGTASPPRSDGRSPIAVKRSRFSVRLRLQWESFSKAYVSEKQN